MNKPCSQQCHEATANEIGRQRICPVCEEPILIGQMVHRTVPNMVIIRHCACDWTEEDPAERYYGEGDAGRGAVQTTGEHLKRRKP
jgi:hypothetical protein